jgi:hypothetical protein
MHYACLFEVSVPTLFAGPTGWPIIGNRDRRLRRWAWDTACIGKFAAALFFVASAPAQEFRPTIPKTWVDEAIASLEVPLATPGASPRHISAEHYYRIPVRKIFKSYPIYAPGREPKGYSEWLSQQEPEIAFDAGTLRTRTDWVRAGEVVFDAPVAYDAIILPDQIRDPGWYTKTGVKVQADGTLPYLRYVIRTKGKVEVGSLSCQMCHTRVLDSGGVVKGAQGNFPFDRAWAQTVRLFAQDIVLARAGTMALYGAPWIKAEPVARIGDLPIGEITAALEAIPPGVLARHGTSFMNPVQVPDLIGVRDRKYLDRTGLQLHRGIEDLMRYAAINQGAGDLAHYGDFSPAALFNGGQDPPAEKLERYSDEQLYALALYIYSLQPPPNPNRFDALAQRGQKVFQAQGCGGCHTPPLYTNNKLVPAPGFTVPKDHAGKYDILDVPVGTDAGLTLKTRRGTGYYKVPSLRGVWYRGPFEHSGSVATLEDWFDPRRLREGYTPTGFMGYKATHRAVCGHEFGLRLRGGDKAALIAFLRTL